MSHKRKVKRILAALCCAYWVPQAYFMRRIMRDVPTVESMPLDGSRVSWPKVSVIIPACNEEDSIEASLRSRLEEDYPDLEIIFVDDRSTDRTGEIADRLASIEPRIKVIHVADLPEGWVGKVHAMYAGTGAAAGDWLLFSDADVQVGKGTLKRTIGFAERHAIDHLPVFPEFLPSGFLLDVVISTLSRLLCMGGRVWAVGDPESNAAVGVGSFNLVRSSALEASPGLEWLKLEVVDDASMGQMLKASGASQLLANGHGYVAVKFYTSIRDALVGSERGMFTAIGGFSLARCVAMGALFTALELAPLLFALDRHDAFLKRLGLAALSTQVGVSIAFNRWFGRPAYHAAFAPLASTSVAVLIIRAGILGKARGGINWRGTFYPTSLLKPGRRFRP